MKRYRLQLLLLALLCFTGFYGNAQSWNWVSHNNLGPSDFVNMVADQNGNTYVTGFDNLGNVLMKYKPDGTMIWSKRDSTKRIHKLSIDAVGNLYVAASEGFFAQAFLYTAKLDSAGNQLWSKGILVPNSPTHLPTAALYANATDSSGNTFTSGNFQDLSGLTHFDTIALGNLSPNNYFLVKYNSTGKIQWLKFFNNPVYAIACGSQGSYFIENGTYFQKYDANDSLIWQQNFSGTFNSSIPFVFYNKLKVDAQGNLFVLGNKLVKYNSNGTLAWTKAFSGNDFSLTNAGNILLTGYFFGNATFGNGVPDLISGSAGSTLLVAQFSGIDGSANWAKQASTTGWNLGQAIINLPNGNCVVAGNFSSGSTFDQHTVAGNGVFVAGLNTTLLGISEKETKINFQLYPNPATSGVTISNPEFRNASVEIFDVAGKKVVEEVYPSEGDLKISTEAWPVGLYIVKVTAKGKIYNQKLVVSH